jgi:carotenoid cleavage dioxygenase
VIDVPGSRLFHDITFTENFTIFPDLPMTWDQAAVAKGRRRVNFDPDTPSRFGVLPRHASGDQIRWFETSSCYAYHMVNAWEETGEDGHPRIVLLGCRIENPLPTRPHAEEPEVPRLYFLRMDPYLHRWTLDLETGSVKEERLDDVRTEFPRMNDGWMGRRSRYAYHQRLAPVETLLFDGVVKYDVHDGSSTEHTYGVHTVGGETTYVPRPGATEEDDGWITTFVTNRADQRSELRVIDAKTMETTAKVIMPRRVPFGFHADWVPGSGIPRESI